MVSGIVADATARATFDAALPAAAISYCRLTAAPATVRRRIIERRSAEAETRGTTLTPSVLGELDRYASRSIAFAESLRTAAFEDFVLATDDRGPEQLAADAVARFVGELRRRPSAAQG